MDYRECASYCVISIHALREEGDPGLYVAFPAGWISIHALREEGDLAFASLRLSALHFYPRPPRGGRRGIQTGDSSTHNFYPRPPRGGRPLCSQCTASAKSISIHALREEGDIDYLHYVTNDDNFYPRPPRGGRPTSR